MSDTALQPFESHHYFGKILLVQVLPYKPVKNLRAREFLVWFVIYSSWTSILQEVIFKNRWHNAAKA